jgi:hypothetical protein
MKVKITHVMADGSIRDSVKGIPVPESLDATYKVITEIIRKEEK